MNEFELTLDESVFVDGACYYRILDYLDDCEVPPTAEYLTKHVYNAKSLKVTFDVEEYMSEWVDDVTPCGTPDEISSVNSMVSACINSLIHGYYVEGSEHPTLQSSEAALAAFIEYRKKNPK